MWNSFKSWHHIGMHDQSLDLLSGSKPFLTRNYKMSLSSFRKDVHMVSREWGLYVDPRMVYIITRLCICCYFWYCKEFLLHTHEQRLFTADITWYTFILNWTTQPFLILFPKIFLRPILINHSIFMNKSIFIIYNEINIAVFLEVFLEHLNG